jgi:FkbM family methyltransferase
MHLCSDGVGTNTCSHTSETDLGPQEALAAPRSSPVTSTAARARTIGLAGHKFVFPELPTALHQRWADDAAAGKWEAPVLDFFAQTVQPGDVVLDVGAWIGPYTLLASRLAGPDGAIYAFEPDPEARRLLELGLEANEARNVEVLPYAVSDDDGKLSLESAEFGNSMTSTSAEPGAHEVTAVTLASFCEERELTPTVLKMDIEGGEGRALCESATELLRAARAILLELHHEPLRAQGFDPHEVLQRAGDWDKRPVALEMSGLGNVNVALVQPRG